MTSGMETKMEYIILTLGIAYRPLGLGQVDFSKRRTWEKGFGSAAHCLPWLGKGAQYQREGEKKNLLVFINMQQQKMGLQPSKRKRELREWDLKWAKKVHVFARTRCMVCLFTTPHAPQDKMGTKEKTNSIIPFLSPRQLHSSTTPMTLGPPLGQVSSGKQTKKGWVMLGVAVPRATSSDSPRTASVKSCFG